MSFILDALRKSEKERRAKQSESLTDQMLTDDATPAHRSRSAWWIGLTMVGLLVMLVVFAWFARQQTEPAIVARKSAQTSTPSPSSSEANQVAITEKEMPPAVEQTQSVDSEVAPSSNQASRPADNRHAPLMLRKKALQVEQQNTSSEAASKAETDNPTSPSAHEAMDEDPAEVVDDEIETDIEDDIAENEAPKPAETAANTPPPVSKPAGNIPFLEELPYEIRQTVPKMTINVLYYSSNPAERFVIINMKKYKTGELTKDSVDLKEIRRDSLVMSYQNQTFRLEKP